MENIFVIDSFHSRVVLRWDLLELFKSSVRTPKNLGCTYNNVIFLGIVGSSLGRNHQNSRLKFPFMLKDDILNFLSSILWNHHNSYISAVKELTEQSFTLLVCCLLRYHHEVLLLLSFTDLATLTHSSEQEASNSGLVSDNCRQIWPLGVESPRHLYIKIE